MGLSELITQLPELIGQAVEANQWLGYGAIFAAMFLENLFPPIPSELIMPLGGFYVQQGQLQFIPVVLAGLIGTVLGALPWYGIGRLINEQRIEQWLEKHGRWIGISAEELGMQPVAECVPTTCLDADFPHPSATVQPGTARSKSEARSSPASRSPFAPSSTTRPARCPGC